MPKLIQQRANAIMISRTPPMTPLKKERRPIRLLWDKSIMHAKIANNSVARRRGAPKGNKNAFKHGGRSREWQAFQSYARLLVAQSELAIDEHRLQRRLLDAAIRLERLRPMHVARQFLAETARELGAVEIFSGNAARRQMSLRLLSRRPSNCIRQSAASPADTWSACRSA